ncbi:MAG: MerC domain-containing protein [Myxococcota bacterium]
MTAENAQSKSAVDKLGVVASTACAVHCATSALVPTVLGALGLGALLGHEAEWGFTVVAILLAAAALWQGWRAHRSVPLALTFGAGIAGLLLSRGVEEAGIHGAGPIIGILAGAALVVGHVMNIRAHRAS